MWGSDRLGRVAIVSTAVALMSVVPAHSATALPVDVFVSTVIGSPGATVGSHVGAGHVDVTIASYDNNTQQRHIVQQIALEQGRGGVPGSSEAGDRFGSTNAVGDFDHDGCRDLAVGAPGEDIGAVADVGAVWVFYGSCHQQPYFTPSRMVILVPGSRGVPGSAQPGQHFGAALSTFAVDPNLDPHEGLLIGAPDGDFSGARDSGEVVKLPDVTHPATGTALTSTQPSLGTVRRAGDHFGASLATARTGQNWETPTNFPTFAIGAPGRAVNGAAGAGAVFVVTPLLDDGSANPHPVAMLDQANTAGVSEAGDHWGASVYYWADGAIATLVVGAPDEDIGSVVDAGAVTVIDRGHASLVVQGSGGVPGASEAGDHFGAAVSEFDDTLVSNSSDVSALVIGTPGEDVGSIVDAGAVFALSGATWQLYVQGANGVPGSAETGDHFGSSFANPVYHHLLVGVPDEDMDVVADAGAVIDIFTDSTLPAHVQGAIIYEGGPHDGVVTGGSPGVPVRNAHFGVL